MPGGDDIRRTLADHEKRLRRVEGLLQQGKIRQTAAKRNSLPRHILSLRDSGFFALPRTAEDVHKKLLPTYHCELDRVRTALRRLAARKQIRKAMKTVNGSRYQAYVW